MHFLSLFLSLLIGLFGIYLGTRAFKRFKKIIQGELSFNGLIMNSIVAGTATTLIFLSMILTMGYLDQEYVWSLNRIRGAIFVSLIPGVIVLIGSFVQSLMVAGYRGILFDALNKKDKRK